jgi:hypothetical protein
MLTLLSHCVYRDTIAPCFRIHASRAPSPTLLSSNARNSLVSTETSPPCRLRQCQESAAAATRTSGDSRAGASVATAARSQSPRGHRPEGTDARDGEGRAPETAHSPRDARHSGPDGNTSGDPRRSDVLTRTWKNTTARRKTALPPDGFRPLNSVIP